MTRRALVLLVLATSWGCGSLPGEYDASITTTLSTNASMTATSKQEPVKITEQGSEVTFVFPACTLKGTRSGDKIELLAGQKCTRDLKVVTLTSGQGEKKPGQVLLAMVWTKEGSAGTINERALLSGKTGCR